MYSKVLSKILSEYEEKRAKKQEKQIYRKNVVYKKLPKIRELDEEIAKIGIETSKAIIAEPEKSEEILLYAKERIEKLRMEKAYILTENNISVDYLEMEYDCKKCKDKGFLENGNKCSCLMQELIYEAYEMSNIKNVLDKENFENFNIKIFPDEAFEGEELTPRENMEYISNICVDYINNFDKRNDENLLFYGSTGLGKTFMCNSIAKALLDMNKIVVYQTAFKILEIIERRRFGNEKDRYQDFQYDLLFSADLLIIDDLGTEVSNTFTNAEIFNIVNTRLISGKKTIISTNLTPKEISEVYTDRVFSRILEKFVPLKFYGPDLRYSQWEK